MEEEVDLGVSVAAVLVRGMGKPKDNHRRRRK